jgi:hypothetical protein
MNDFEEIDGKLVYVCNHEWGKWYNIWEPHENVSKRHCAKCTESQLLLPVGYGEDFPPLGLIGTIKNWFK